MVNSDSINSAEQILILEGELLQKDQEFLEQELKFKENFTLLEDEKPTKNFLNLESTKGGYNEITVLREISSTYDPNQEEGPENIKYNVFRNQPLIRDKVTGSFQKVYNKQPNLETSREGLIHF